MDVMVIDSCCLINLYASQNLTEIVTASIKQAVIPKEVLKESLYIRQKCEDDPDSLIPVQVDLSPFIDNGVLKVTEPAGETESEDFIRLAGIIDDGEAACLAIASNRGIALATDDRRAINVATDLGVSIVTTPDLIKNWINCRSPESHQVANVIRCIEQYGRFRPHLSSPHIGWWNDQS